MVPDVQERPGEAEHHQIRPPEGAPEQRQADAHADDADVLDAVVREQPLEVVLADGEGDAEHARHDPEAQDDAAPPSGEARKQRRDPDDAVDAHLDDDARHDGRDVARRVGVRARQPDVQRHDARLQPEADEGEDEDRDGEGAVRIERSLQVPVAAQAEERREHGEQAQRPDARRDQVDVAGLADLLVLVVRRDEQERRQRHDLPADQEQERVAGDHEQRHAGGQHAVEEA